MLWDIIEKKEVSKEMNETEAILLLTLTWVIPLTIFVVILIDYVLFRIWHYNAHKNDLNIEKVKTGNK